MRELHGEQVRVFAAESEELSDALAEAAAFVKGVESNRQPGRPEFFRLHQMWDEDGYTVLVSVVAP